MRSVVALLLGALALASAAGCEADDDVPVSEVREQEKRDGGASVPRADCSGLDACTCLATEGCAPITTDCWCPDATCGSSRACACEGGRYLGCGPTGGGCLASSCSLLAEATPPSDENRCGSCAVPADCDGAVARLSERCPSLTVETTGWMCDPALSVCATFCLGQVRNCGQAACFFCEACSCESDGLSSCLLECDSLMQARHL